MKDAFMPVYYWGFSAKDFFVNVLQCCYIFIVILAGKLFLPQALIATTNWKFACHGYKHIMNSTLWGDLKISWDIDICSVKAK